MFLQIAHRPVIEKEMGGEIEPARYGVGTFLGGLQQASQYRRNLIGRLEACPDNVCH